MSDTPRTDALREVVIGQYKEDELTGNGMGNILAALTDIETLERERECECKCDVDWPEEYYELRQRLERERDEAREEIESIKKLLLDPNAVRINMLHGKIAKLDWEKLEHIHGPHPARDQLAAERALAEQRGRLYDTAIRQLKALERDLDRLEAQLDAEHALADRLAGMLELYCADDAIAHYAGIADALNAWKEARSE